MKSLLVSGHPGHELRLHHWMETVQPDVFIITDGSGSAGRPRMESSRRIISRAGARLLQGSGELSDRRLYAAMRDCDESLFSDLRARIGRLIRTARYDEVVCDGLEGFNTTHDWCHYLIRSLTGPLGLRAFEHSLAGAPDAWTGANHHRVSLDDAALKRKLHAAGQYEELSKEVEESLREWGDRAFSLEVLRPIPALPRPPAPPGQPAFYEVFGDRRVREGAYPEVIRWETHLRPLVERVWDSSLD